jgi:integrase
VHLACWCTSVPNPSDEPRKLYWNKKTRSGDLCVDLKRRVLRLDSADVKESYPRITPISPPLMRVLMELRPADSIAIEPVFVRLVDGERKPIKSIRSVFNTARIKAGIPNAIPHDLRRSTIRRWEMAGVSRQAVMQATGHRPNTVHEMYAELSEEQLLQAFAPLFAEPKSKTSAKAG